MPILEINFVIRGSRRRLNCDAAIQLANPIGLAGGRLDARDGLALAIEHIKPSLIKQWRRNIAGYLAVLALPGQH